MLDRVKTFLINHELLDKNKTFVLGFSGGFDSMCLLHILKTIREEVPFRLIAVHLNHGWRGVSADTDERNSFDFCKKHDISYFSEKIDPNLPKTETAAREARYDFFRSMAQKYNADGIFTAHTKSDNAETIIYRIIKGTGGRGLQGIVPVRNFTPCPIYRPALGFLREEVENYCKAKQLVPNNDLTNFDKTYSRNFIRLEVVPLLKEINPKLENSLENLTKISISEQKILSEYITCIKKTLYTEDEKILTEVYEQLSEDVQKRVIYDLLFENELDYDYKKIKEIHEFLQEATTSKSGKTCSLTSNLWLYANQEFIYPIKSSMSYDNVDLEISSLEQGEYPFDGRILKIEKMHEQVECFPLETDLTAFVDMSAVKLPLRLRTRQTGDVIQPFGMKSPIKLKKYFINKGIAQHKKDRIVLLCQDKEVLWAAGVGISEKLRVIALPTHVLRIVYAKNSQ